MRAVAASVATPSATLSSSTGTTQSQPWGSTAPVMTSMQWRVPAERERRVTGGLRRLHAQRARAGRQRRGERDAIHGHAVEGRLVTLGVDVLAQHRAGALRERQRLDRQTLQVLPDQQIRVGRCEHSALLVGRALLVDLHLLVEAVGDALQLVDGGVVLLRLHLLHLGLLRGLERIALLGDGVSSSSLSMQST